MLRRDQKDYIKRTLPRFKLTMIAAVSCLIVSGSMLGINNALEGKISQYDILIAETDANIETARIPTYQDVFTNIDNVRYDTMRCKDDDAAMFALIKPIISYKNADDFNISRQDIVKETNSAAISLLFPKIDYAALDYKNETDYKGNVCEMYTSTPVNFQSYLMNIDENDVYTYTGIATVSLELLSETSTAKTSRKDCIVFTYSTNAAGDIDYGSIDGMRCSNIR